MIAELNPRQKLLLAQQQLIEALPDSIDVELAYQSNRIGDIRISRSLPGGPHPNHTNIHVVMYIESSLFEMSCRQGFKRQTHTSTAPISFDKLLELVKSKLHIFSIPC